MSALIAILFLGVLQGLTEFLPVSSSGHLSLFQYFSKNLHDSLTANIAVHVGTLLTIVVYYRKDLFDLFKGVLSKERVQIKMVLLIVIASIPTAIIGLLMKKYASWVLTHPLVAALCLVVTGVILSFSSRFTSASESQQGFGLSFGKAFLIGVVQGFAVLPGISRSGSTIVAGLGLGMTPYNASRFSFLVSLPAILGASLLEFWGHDGSVNLSHLALGALVSFLVGLVAIAWMVKLTLRGSLKSFSYYVFLLGGLFLICYSQGWGRSIL